MLSHYLLIAWRDLLKNKFISLINLAGLTTGLTFCLLAGMYISYELSYDKLHSKGDDIYRVICHLRTNEEITHQYTGTPCPLGPALVEEFPDIIEFLRISDWGGDVIHQNGNYFNGEKVYITDNSIFDFFDIPFIKGDPKTALSTTDGAVISEDFAKKMFGNENPIGQVFDYKKDRKKYKITGVAKEMPENSHWKFNVLLPNHHVVNDPNIINDWYDNFGFNTYVVIKSGADSEYLATQTRALYARHWGEDDGTDFSFQPLYDIHLYSNYLNWEQKRGDLKNLYFLGIVGLFIIIIAWINYINLSISKSFQRAMEIGVVKVLGARKEQLVAQFLLESTLLNFIAFCLAIAVLLVVIPIFNQQFGLHLSLFDLSPIFWFFVLLFFCFGIIASGLYPALVISRFEPALIMKGYGKSTKGVFFRKIIVVFQFLLCVLFIACNLIVFNQLNYLKSKDLGIELGKIALITNPTRFKHEGDPILEKNKVFKTEIQKYSQIEGSTLSNHPGSGFFSKYELSPVNKPSEKRMIEFAYIDEEFTDVYGLDIVAGSNIRESSNQDFLKVLVNEKAVKVFGYKKSEDIIGELLSSYKNQNLEVVGVVNDYHQQSAKVEIPPVCFKAHPYSPHEYYSIKLNTSDSDKIKPIIEKEFSKFFPESVFEFVQLTDLYDWQYIDDNRFFKFFNLLAIVAIILSCMGLLALSSHVMINKKKEMSIRKSLGASSFNISLLLLKDILTSAIIASIFGLIFAYYISFRWLENFAFQINIGPWFYIVPVLILFPILFITVLYHTLKLVNVDIADALAE